MTLWWQLGVKVFIVLLQVHPAFPACSSGFTEHNGICYRVTVAGNWEFARHKCIQYGKILAEIRSVAQQNDVVSFLNSEGIEEDVWIGARAYSGSDFRWGLDNSSVEYTSWTSGEPNSDNSCVRLHYDSEFKWADKDCADSYRTLCMEPVPVTCSVGENVYGACWHHVEDSTIRATAQSECSAVGGGLADFRSQTESTLVRQIVTSLVDKETWIGMSSVDDSRGTYRWSDQVAPTWNGWKTGHPDSTRKPCVSMHARSDGDENWQTKACSDSKAYLCRIPPLNRTCNEGDCPTQPVPSQSCYVLGTSAITIETAQDNCASEGGILAMVRNTQEKTAISSALERIAYNDYYWIGGNASSVHGVYRWYDGTLVDGANYWSDYDSDEHCLAHRGTGSYSVSTDFHTVACDTTLKEICQYPINYKCFSPPDVSNADLVSSTDTTATYTCKYGYKHGTELTWTVTCDSCSTQFSSCTAVVCASAPVLPNATASWSLTEGYGHSLTFNCIAGHHTDYNGVLAQSGTIICGVDDENQIQGAWPIMPGCYRSVCDNDTVIPASFDQSYLAPPYSDVWEHNNGVEVQCPLGYKVNDSDGGIHAWRKCIYQHWEFTDGINKGCIASVCNQDPPSLVYANVTWSSNTYGSTATYECDEGFLSSTPITSTCSVMSAGETEGVWTTPVQYCYRNQTMYGIPEYGTCTDLSVSADLAAEFDSSDGCPPSGRDESCTVPVCDVSTIIDPQLLLFAPKNACPSDSGYAMAISVVDSGNCSAMGGTYSGNTCSLDLCPGYLATASSSEWMFIVSRGHECPEIVHGSLETNVVGGCGAYGQQAVLPDADIQTASQCAVSFCPVHSALECVLPWDILLQDTSRTEFDIGYIITVSCFDGFELSNGYSMTNITCSVNGTTPNMTSWEPTDLTCQRVACSEPPTIENAVVTYSSHIANNDTWLFEDYLIYRCNIGFVAPGDVLEQNVSCQANQSWSSHLTNCEARQCDGTFINGNITVLGFPSGQDSSVKDGNPSSYTTDSRNEALGYSSSTDSDISGDTNDGVSSTTEATTGDSKPPEDISSTDQSYIYDVLINLTCHEGHFIEAVTDSLILTCTENGTWNGTTICTSLDCGRPTVVNNATVDYDTTTYGSMANYTCDPGFVLRPGNSIEIATWSSQCNYRHGSPPTPYWSHADFYCEIVNCTEQPPEVADATVSIVDSTYQGTAVYTCRVGYRTDNGDKSFNITCQVNVSVPTHSFWEQPHNTCIKIPTEPPIVETTAANYRLIKTTEITTIESSEFIEPVRFLCDFPPLVPHSHLNITGFGIGDAAEYTCLYGYYHHIDHTPSRSSICVRGFVWIPDDIQCIPRECPPHPMFPSSTLSHTVRPTDRVIGSYVRYDCVTGTRSSRGLDHFFVLCTRHLSWQTRSNGCSGQNCPAFPIIVNGGLGDYTTHKGGFVLGRCDLGHSFQDGTKFRSFYCVNGEWHLYEYGECYLDVCPPLLIPTDGGLNTTISVFGTTVNVFCDVGYWFVDQSLSIDFECLDGGVWNKPQYFTECIEVQCQAPLAATNATITGTGPYKSMTEVTYTCAPGMRTWHGYESKTVICNPNGLWSDIITNCASGRCPPVPSLPMAKPDSMSSEPNRVVGYVCDFGYMWSTRQRKLQLVCQDGVWNETQDITCTETLCLTTPDPPNAVDVTNLTSYPVGSVINYKCKTGYKLVMESEPFFTNCTQYGTWTTPSNQCEVVRCLPIPQVVRSTSPINVSGIMGDTIRFTCMSGYHFIQNVRSIEVECLSSGAWWPSVRNCTEITCEAAWTWTHGMIVSNTTTEVGATINATCDTEYKLSSGDEYMVSSCDENGLWDPPLEECVDVSDSTITVEATGSQEIGAVYVGLASIVPCTIIVLDIFTCAKHLTLLKRNLNL